MAALGGSVHGGSPHAAEGDGYAAFALRWWWVVVACVLAGGGGAYAYSRFGPVPYQSTALVLAPQPADPLTGGQRSASASRGTAENYAAQASSQLVFELTSKALAGKLPGGLTLRPRDLLLMSRQKDLDVRQQRGSNVVSISVTDTDPRIARAVADTLAEVFVEDVNARSKNDLDSHRTQLEQQIEQTRQRLITSQLRQREQELAQQLRAERSQLLQLQLQYQQEVQRQVEMDRLAAGIDQSLTATPPPATRAADVPAAPVAPPPSRTEAIVLLEQQAIDLQRSVDSLTAQIEEVRRQSAEASAGIPSLAAEAAQGAPAETTAQREIARLKALQAQRTQLLQREEALRRQSRDLGQELRQVKQQEQQELERQAEAQRAAANERQPAAQPTLTADQRQQLDRAAAAAREASAQRLQLLRQQQRDLEKSIASVDAQIEEVRANLSRLPDEATLDAALVQATAAREAELVRQQQEVDRTTAVRARVNQYAQQEQALQRQLDSQRAELRQVQLQHVREMDRQVDAERQAQAAQAAQAAQQASRATAVPTARAATAAAPLATQQDRLRELADTAAAVRLRWLQATAEQQREVERNVSDLTRKLDEVRTSLQGRPTNTDPLLDAAFASAYTEQLQSLTSEYARGQINAQMATTPLIRYGGASDPLPIVNVKKTLAIGIGGGLASGAALAYLFDVVARARRERAWRAQVAAARAARRALLVPPHAQNGAPGAGVLDLVNPMDSLDPVGSLDDLVDPMAPGAPETPIRGGHVAPQPVPGG